MMEKLLGFGEMPAVVQPNQIGQLHLTSYHCLKFAFVSGLNPNNHLVSKASFSVFLLLQCLFVQRYNTHKRRATTGEFQALVLGSSFLHNYTFGKCPKCTLQISIRLIISPPDTGNLFVC